MKDVMILTGISLGRNREMSLRKAWRRLREHSTAAFGAFGAISFLAILLDFDGFGSIMAIVSLLALWMGEEGGRK